MSGGKEVNQEVLEEKMYAVKKEKYLFDMVGAIFRKLFLKEDML